MIAATHDPRSPVVSSMSGEIERIKLELLEEYEGGSLIDIGAWTVKFPVYREELVDYWMWLRGTPRLSEVDPKQGLSTGDSVAREAVRQACLAVSFGSHWLDDPVDPDLRADQELGAELARIRAMPYHYRGKAPQAFRKAVVYAWIVQELRPRRERVTRLAAQKVAYILEQGLRLGVFTEHQQKPLGPYDHKAKYRDAEPIATRNGWMRVEGTSLEPGQSTSKFDRYVQNYIRSQSLAQRLVERLARLTDEELEIWATLSWVGHALASKGEEVTVEGVQSFLAHNQQWKAKLGRRSFEPQTIAATLARLSRLHLLQG